MTADEKLEMLRVHIASELEAIRQFTEESNLDLPLLTLVARHPDDDEMIIVVSNDDEKAAFDAARKQLPD